MERKGIFEEVRDYRHPYFTEYNVEVFIQFNKEVETRSNHSSFLAEG